MPLPHDPITPEQHSVLPKKKQVANMFDRIAGRYDFMNRLLSGQIDRHWRKAALRKLKAKQPKYILDVATGTADFALMASAMYKEASITGIDISSGMLAEGRKKILRKGLQSTIELQEGDAETINAPANTFDAVTVAFGVRNFENLLAGLSEMHRVLKPDGQVLILEFSTPRNPLIRFFYNTYMKRIAPILAKIFGTDHHAYTYLNRSSNAFPDREHFIYLLKEAGYTNASFQPLTFGICCIYTASK
ncbi:MAG: bifunctional demethylmenaquinone methyltransferase/2-methoxy-6-polyprenyl-1,4-benzoquinol methylase UbiE [Bacteroidetes bacterium]|nr:bifunctional demethylmenaquinone methyltransferase/2-methoxy-6-polyprenyl-1,4-benzoquinol methylase UbiE [Bacteroidota bacterium]